MKRIYSIVLFIFFRIAATQAQSITGKVAELNGESIPFANVMLLNSNDSSLVAGCVTNAEGYFCLESINHKLGILKISFLGYDDLYHSISAGMTNIGTIVLIPKAISLGEVTVKASKPVFRQRNGAIVTAVSGSVLSKVHSMSELLSQIPGIVKSPSGEFEVLGSGSPIIYINSKKIQDKTEVDHLTPKDIESIELITNPGAKYDAEGKSVLNIVTLKKVDGLTLQAGSDAKQNDQTSYGSNFKIGYKHNRLNLSANYEYNDSKDKSYLPQTKEFFMGENRHKFVQNQKSKGRLQNHQWQANIDYGISANHNIGLEWDGMNYESKELRKSTLDYLRNSDSSQSTKILNDYSNKVDFNHLNLFHNGKWGKLITTDFNLDYARNDNTYNQNTDEMNVNALTFTLSKGKSTLDILAGKLSLNYRMNKKSELSLGVEYNHIKGDGNLLSNTDNTSSSNYSNKENKYAAYAEICSSIGCVNINAGLRYEYITSKYIDYLNNGGNVNRHYKDFYPSLSLSYCNNSWTNTLSFSSRTTRPSFSQLSNSNYYSNEFMYQCGNPLLKPSKSYIAQWNTGYKFINFSVGYTYMKDYISTDFYTSDNKRTQIVSSYTNYDKIQYLKVNLTLQKNISWWKPSFTLGIIKPLFASEYLGKKMKYNKPQMYVLFNQYIQLPKSYLLSIYYYLNSGGNQGAVELKTFQMLNFGLQKSYFNDKISVSIQAYDILHTMKYRENEYIKNISFSQTEDYRVWNYSISVIYRLNSLKTKYRGKSSIADEIDRL